MTRAHRTQLDRKTHPIGCPCGHLEAGECITRTPIAVTSSAPCDGTCRTHGLEEIAFLAREYGCCLCNRQAVAS